MYNMIRLLGVVIGIFSDYVIAWMFRLPLIPSVRYAIM